MKEFIQSQPSKEYSVEEMSELLEQLNVCKKDAAEQLRATDPNSDPEERLAAALGELEAAFGRSEPNDRLLAILENAGVAPKTAVAIIFLQKALYSSHNPRLSRQELPLLQ